MSEIKDITLKDQGHQRIAWAKAYMPLLNRIERRFSEEKPFLGKRISISIHLEAKTAYLAYVLRAGGAEVHCTGCNPLSTQDEIAAALVDDGFCVHAIRGVDMETYQQHIRQTLLHKPHLILDDGGDLLHTLTHGEEALAENLIGGTEETTTGVLRMRQMEKRGSLPFPMIAVNDARCKHLFDNRYGTGQSTWDAILRTTNLVVAGKIVVVAGYGWCARGIALRAKGLGAQVVVTEVDPVRAIEAAMDGYRVMTMEEASRIGDVFITATGCKDIITKAHFLNMKDGVLLANSGHFDVEINKEDLAQIAQETFEQRKNIMGYRLPDGRVLNLLGEGRLVNLAAGDGHPVEIMDMSFAVQALCLEYMLKAGGGLSPSVYQVPQQIDQAVAKLKLSTMGISIDTLTPQQQEYLG